MNPNTVIRPWLEACSTTFGHAKAYDYRLADADTRPQHEYFTYKIMFMEESDELPERKNKRTGNELHRRALGQWITTVMIDLHKSQNGMMELAQCCIAANDDNPNIKAIFEKDSCAYLDCLSIENLTPEENENSETELKEKYHHRMLVRFYDNIYIQFDEQNEVVNEVNIDLDLIND